MEQKKSGLPIIIITAAAVLIAAAAGIYIGMKPKTAPAEDITPQISAMMHKETADGIIPKAVADTAAFELIGDAEASFRSAKQNVKISWLDTAALTAGLEEDMQEILYEYVNNASRPRDVYDENGKFLDEITKTSYDVAINNRLLTPERYTVTEDICLELKYSDGGWHIENPNVLEKIITPCADVRPELDNIRKNLQYIEFHYRLDDWTSPAPKPNQACFGETDDPSVVSALLKTPAAQKLMNGQQTDWREDKEFLPDTKIYYYLDDTILAIVWKECEHGAVGTFSEVFIADATQLRRKIADDSFACGARYFPTELSRQVNAVVAVSGDFYDHPDRTYGVYAYDGKVMKSCLTDGQSCYFTDTGDMIFSYENQFADVAAAQRFLDENHVMFSLSFGPVILDNGVDVTPYGYPLGEVLDTYARCCIGQLGKLHYLAMTINCQSPDYYVYVTLRQAADSMIAHGCKQAYTIDGGQTGSIIINNQLINPVQFGVEREMSDIFYFATAIPED